MSEGHAYPSPQAFRQALTRAEAGRSLLLIAPTLTEALAVVRPFVDPLLAGAAVGRWDSKLGHWTR